MPEKYNSIGDQPPKFPGSEEISALVDGESTDDIDALFQGAGSDSECRATWRRYHLMRDVIQRDYCPTLCTNMAENISLQILKEDSHTSHSSTNVVPIGEKAARTAGETHPRPQRRTWLPVAGLGLAASVAAAGFMAWQVNGDRNDGSNPVSTASIETLRLDQPVDTPTSGQPIVLANADVPTSNSHGTRWLVSTASPRDQQVEKRLNSLLLNHLEDSTMGRVQGMLTHSRVVAYDTVPVNESF